MRLTPTQVFEIFVSEEKTVLLAAAYGVSESTIRSIKRRRSHPDQTGQFSLLPGRSRCNRHILDDATVEAIYYFSGSIKELKARFGVSKIVANNIKFGLTYKEVTEGLGFPGELKIHNLSWDDVCTIRSTVMDSASLAEIFGVSKGTINNIRSGRTRRMK